MSAPDRGDLVWLDFSPQAGHEQAERRPAIVLSPRAYHQKTPYVIV
jgi:mRNA interferase MazF